MKDNASGEESIESVENMDLLRLFDEHQDRYESGIKAKWHLTPPDIDDAMSISYEREYLHEITKEFEKRKLFCNKLRLDALDEAWKEWLLECIKDGDVKEAIYPMPQMPADKWWFHIETLETKVKPQETKVKPS